MNYKHLHYFWAVARSGSVARASERLHLTPQTISTTSLRRPTDRRASRSRSSDRPT